MRFEYDAGELDILEKEEETEKVNIAETLAGLTLTINYEYELKPTEIPNTFVIIKKAKEK